MFDAKALHGYIRDDAYDMTVIQEIFAGEQKQNVGDGGTAVAMSEMYAFFKNSGIPNGWAYNV
jgi:hypothetical protein